MNDQNGELQEILKTISEQIEEATGIKHAQLLEKRSRIQAMLEGENRKSEILLEGDNFVVIISKF